MKHGRLYAATDVARFCGVDLTTIHSWVQRRSLEGERSPGGQLRFRRTDVVRFLRARGFPLPLAFARERARIVLVGEHPRELAEALAARAEVTTERSPIPALLDLRRAPPDALVLGATLGFGRPLLVRELSAAEPRLVLAALATSPAEGVALREAGATVAGEAGDSFAGAVLELVGAAEGPA